jgi:3-phosphoshikimate 1-carboxyvinyltransferase
MRLLMGVAAIGNSKYTLTGTPRMCERPVNSLLNALNQLLVSAVSINNTGNPPVEIKGSGIKERKVDIDCSISSQYLSSLLLIAPFTLNGLEINVVKGPVSKPYIDMTVDIMRQLNIDVIRKGYNYFKILPGQVYKSGKYTVEPDCSQAGYFWAAAAITGKKIKVLGISSDTKQGDVRFANVFKSMGCNVSYDHDGISVTGGKLHGIEVDMADMPDMVPTLAVVAAFAKGKTVIKNVKHLKAKESDRLGSVVAELKKMGVDAFCDDSTMVISGGRKPAGAVIKTYDDHRMAMSFAISGLIVSGISIQDEKCVEKSFPNFWEVFKGMYE